MVPKKVIASPLRYPGGKFRAVKHIIPLYPDNMSSLCSPFFGGGNVEINLARMGVSVYGYDIFKPLVNFWQQICKDPYLIAWLSTKYYPMIPPEYFYYRDNYNVILNKQRQAAVFYVLNRCSFAGLTFRGGMIHEHHNFNPDKIRELAMFDSKNLQIECMDYKDSISQHSNDYLYCDPPYFNISTRKLYGTYADNMQKEFKHEQLANILKNRDGWVLSYNDCEEARDLYSGYRIIEPEWMYSMYVGNTRRSKEILVLSKDLT